VGLLGGSVSNLNKELLSCLVGATEFSNPSSKLRCELFLERSKFEIGCQIYAADLLEHLVDVGADDAVEMAVWARGEEVFEREL
jgi:hypothetical protein